MRRPGSTPLASRRPLNELFIDGVECGQLLIEVAKTSLEFDRLCLSGEAAAGDRCRGQDRVAHGDPEVGSAKRQPWADALEGAGAEEDTGEDWQTRPAGKQASALLDGPAMADRVGVGDDAPFGEDANDSTLAEADDGRANGADRHAPAIDGKAAEVADEPRGPSKFEEFDPGHPIDVAMVEHAEDDGVDVAEMVADEEIPAGKVEFFFAKGVGIDRAEADGFAEGFSDGREERRMALGLRASRQGFMFPDNRHAIDFQCFRPIIQTFGMEAVVE